MLNFIGLNFDVDTQYFIDNFDKNYCMSQYEKYLEMRKNYQIAPTPTLVIPPIN